MRYKSTSTAKTIRSAAADDALVHDLAQFRYALRRFLRFSENAARQSGVTPQQHQLMLGVAGFTGRGSATVRELAEFLQEKPHSVVGLIERAAQNGLVRRVPDKVDRRVVNVMLTAKGKDILTQLSQLHQQEALRVQAFLAERIGADPQTKGSPRDARTKEQSSY